MIRSQFTTLHKSDFFIGTARIVREAGSMKRHGVCRLLWYGWQEISIDCCTAHSSEACGGRMRVVGATLSEYVNTDLSVD